MKKRIAVDVDGVLGDFVGHLCRKLSARGHDYRPGDFATWDLSSTLTHKAQEDMKRIIDEPGFCQSIPWYPSARLFLTALHEIGDVFIATAPSYTETWSYERNRWLEAAEFPRHKILSVPSRSKHLAVSFCDILIEDRAETLEDWLGVKPVGVGILIDRPWNRSTNVGHRVYNFKEALQIANTGVR